MTGEDEGSSADRPPSPSPLSLARKEVKALTKALKDRSKNEAERAAIRVRVHQLERLIRQLTPPHKRKYLPRPPMKAHVPEPKSYRKAVAEKREAAHRVSGFDRVRAVFVQGGSPGSGKGK